jgi:hypothetical protein
MPEKVRVSPAAALQLSTGGDQAALVPEDVELLEDDVEPEELLDDPDDEEPDEDDPDAPEDPEDDDSDFAGTVLLPDDRLSVR